MRFNRFIIIILSVVVILAGVGIWSIKSHKDISIIGIGKMSDTPTAVENGSSIAGLQCDRAKNRVVTVMIAADKEARPLSGIGSADIVFEMPVTPDGITRMMAGFQCEVPKEIGSIRSAREDFVPLAAGLKSIYAHWGGEHGVLDQLNHGVINNLDALVNQYNEFYRKASIRPPHNGFTTIDLLENAAKKKGYSLTDDFAGYPHSTAKPTRNLSNIATDITVNYNAPYNVSWHYDEQSNTYLRSRNGTPEIDKTTGKQVAASVVVIMKTTSKLWYDQYLRVTVQGQGNAAIYQNGIISGATWSKDTGSLDGKLLFSDGGGKEIAFVPGKIWVEIIAENN